ncbi:MAG: polysaccharide deacetylase family protein [Alphaproteobacteria bacterium]
MISFTIDLEDYTGQYEPDGRYVIMTRRILDLCDSINCKATFFIVGRVAEGAPRLIQEIASKGHEVAYHSHNHVSLTEETPERFKRESDIDKDRFEQLIGSRIIGFRAPRFSLTPESQWAIDVLGDLGFRYSSSLMPTHLSRFGFPGASRGVSQWPNGMVEVPLPVADLGPMRIPYLGGIYLYALPSFLTRHWLKRANHGEMLWTYTHPYDFDLEEQFRPMVGEPFWVSAVLWGARSFAEKKVCKLLSQGTAPPLGLRVIKLI